MNKILYLVFIVSVLASCKKYVNVKENKYCHRVDSVMSLMTLEEKVGQMVQFTSRFEMTGPAPSKGDAKVQLDLMKKGMVGSMLNVNGVAATRKAQEYAVKNSRLGIPMIFGYDVVHGYKTMFPIPLAMASSWDPDIVKKASVVAARETASSGVHWTFAPMIDISRDARWGRTMEGSGEDAYLASHMAAAAVKGFQGNSLLKNHTIAACAKHFAAYGFAEAGRDYNSVEMSEATMRDVVLPPFKAAADAGVVTFMNAFNTINGVPATGSVHLQRDILKGEWGFDGYVVSDWGSIGEMVIHGAAENNKEAALKAIKAGSDMDMESNAYVKHLKDLVEEGKVDEKLVDDAVRRILTVKFRLGLFDDPYKYCNADLEKKEIYSKKNIEISKEIAKRSIVLLKNDNNILPLKRGTKVAVIGPLADDKDSPLGSWRAQAVKGSAVSLLEGMKKCVSNKKLISFAKGCELTTEEANFLRAVKHNITDRSGFAKAKAVAKKADVVLLAIGENCFESGEGRSKTDIKLKGLQEELLDEILKVNINVVLVLSNGRALDISEISGKVPVILETWHLGSASGDAIAEVVYGKYNPSGKLPVTFPRNLGQVPIYYNQLNTGRPSNDQGIVFWSHYNDSPKTPLYPFGFGLSYTKFKYSDLKLSSNKIHVGEEIKVSVKVSNVGNYDGEEVAQLYIQDVVGSRARPVKELKGFNKIFLKKGESKIMKFKLTSEELKFWTINNKFEVEPGKFKVFVGTNSQEVLTDSLVVE